MSVLFLTLTPQDPIISRDGRPFGAGQGHRMRGLPWLLPSVVAGSFRTALVKAGENLTFDNGMPDRLLKIAVHGVFPVHDDKLYLPAPLDAVAEPYENGKGIKKVHRTTPQQFSGGCDFPADVELQPVLLPDGVSEFKPGSVPAWWPVGKYIKWLTTGTVHFDDSFLNAAATVYRDHVELDPTTGAAKEGKIFSSANLHISHLPRFRVKQDDEKLSLDKRCAKITLTARVTIHDDPLANVRLDHLHPLGGERRLVHWKTCVSKLWECPPLIRTALETATTVRMILATPAILTDGWKPNLASGPLKGFKLVGVSNGRWKAVSGWSMQPHKETRKPGPKSIRRTVPAGSVYFFTCEKGAAAPLADQWLQSVSDNEQEQRDGFGLALWGTW
ncbi:MAG: type III-B CRISPR module-associated Cmr3 family protein [Gemmataceae bacterium]